MLPRLLPLLCLLFLSKVSSTQESGTAKPARVPENVRLRSLQTSLFYPHIRRMGGEVAVSGPLSLAAETSPILSWNPLQS